MRIEAQPQPRERLLRELPKAATYDTARHEVMHGLINPYDVLGISVVAEGNTLGWTLMRNADDTARAAGIVHGYGSSHDELMIRLNNPGAPDMAVNMAVENARAILAGKEGLIDLMARELALRGTMSGSEFTNLLHRAQNEINGKHEEPIDWTLFFGEKPEQDEVVVVEIPDDDPFNINIPKHGKYELTVTTTEGKKVYIYENGAHVKTETWSLIPPVDEPENYGEIETPEPRYEKVDEEDISITPPDKITLPTSATVYTFNPSRVEISLN